RSGRRGRPRMAMAGSRGARSRRDARRGPSDRERAPFRDSRMTSSLLLFFALFLFFLLLSAFFAASETALVALGRSEVQHMRERKVRGIERIERLKKHPARLLSAALIGQNLANSAASAVATVVAENL